MFRLNPLSLVELCRPILENIESPQEALTFAEKLGEKVKRNEEAQALTIVYGGFIQLQRLNDTLATKVILFCPKMA